MKKGFLTLILGILFVSSEGFALIHGQALVGQRKLKVKSGGESRTGQEFKLAVHLDPIPLVPIGFGAYLSATDYDVPAPVKSFLGTEIGLEVTAWLPVGIVGLTPYAKLGYTFMGGYVREVESTDGSYKILMKPSGTRIAAGLKWSPLPLIALLFELEQTEIALKQDKIKSSSDLTGIDLGVADLKTESFGILVGVELGI